MPKVATRGSTCTQTDDETCKKSKHCIYVDEQKDETEAKCLRREQRRHFISRNHIVSLTILVTINQASGFLHMARHHHHKSAANSSENSTTITTAAASAVANGTDVLDKLGNFCL
jgi:hypothetical protein